ncbi:hypothetical protein [Synechocystis sp. PCC 7509]|uniref:hypothetical protein n=1 Tax=Synechocystis sp. PCC 7509 TaxID=927677 RepID=UPI0002AC293A|nr:hypothetical protein [Synechocystis sp. PCC 7509]
MPITAQEVYNQVVRTLPSTEQLRLANLILNELVEQNISDSDTWTERDRFDTMNFSLQHFAILFPEDEARC